MFGLSNLPLRHTHTHTHLPTARTVTSPWVLRRCSALRGDGLLISGHFFWLQRVQMFLLPPGPPMVCRWLHVCLGAPGGAPGDTGVMGGVGLMGEVGVSGGLERGRETRRSEIAETNDSGICGASLRCLYQEENDR